jgi:hypothetical protein
MKFELNVLPSQNKSRRTGDTADKSPIDNFLMQAYLNRELDAVTEAAFEEELIRRPELALLAEADVALSLGLQLEQAAPISAVEPFVSSKPQRGKSQFKHTILLAAATAVVAILAGVVGYRMNASQSQALVGVQLAYVDKLRNDETVLAIALPKDQMLVLMVPVASAEACLAEIEMLQDKVYLKTGSKPDEYGFAAVIVPHGKFRLGKVEVRVQCNARRVGLFALEFK